MEDPKLEAQAALPLGAGERLRAARMERGLTLEQVAAQTRIPQRQLVSLEAGEFASLPGRTYAIGFTRTYAKLVGLDSEELAAQVRAELDADSIDPRHRTASFEPGDPARVPSRLLGWLSVLAVILVLAGLFAFFRPYFTPAAELPSLIEQQQADQRAAAAARTRQEAAASAPVSAAGPVVFTALAERVWVQFTDGNGKQLLQKELVRGETYTVPADVPDVRLRTAHPEALAITIGGRQVPKLADVQRTVSDVPVTAQALASRATASSSASGSASRASPVPAAGAATASPRSSPVSSSSPTT